MGSIQAEFEPELRTNQAVTLKRECTLASACSRRNFHFNEKIFGEGDNGAIKKEKGDEFGHFNFGSTIVLIFEAPDSFNFCELGIDTRVMMGQKL